MIEKRKFGIKTYSLEKGDWSLGITFCHYYIENFIHVGFGRWYIEIGLLECERWEE